MYFLSENMFFLRIVQIIDINPKKFDALGYSFLPFQNPEKDRLTSELFASQDRLTKKHETAPVIFGNETGKNKKRMPRPGTKTEAGRRKKVKHSMHTERQHRVLYNFTHFFVNLCFRFKHFSKNHLSPRRLIFRGHLPSFFSFALCKTQAAKKTQKIRLIGLIRLIKQYLIFHNIHSLSFIVILFFAFLFVAAFLRTRTNTTQLLSKDTFYIYPRGDILFN